MSAAGFTGYLCPLFGESTLNVDCPAVFLPATIAHEFSHQRGVAAEQEANFVAIRASTTCGDAAYEYSGWLMGYLYLSNAWYSADPQAASKITAPCAMLPAPTWPTTTPIGPSGKARSKRQAARCIPVFCAGMTRPWA